MSNEILETRFASELELRGSDGRTVTGIAVPYGVEAEIFTRSGSFRELFRKGSFRKTLMEQRSAKSKIRLFAQHDTRKFPLGVAEVLREDDAGLYGEFRISRTQAGDEVLELLRDGALDSFSIGFIPVPERDRWTKDRSMVERTEVKLREVSVVSFPAYAGAKVEAIRDFDPDDEQSAPKLAVWRRKLLTL